MKREVYDRDWNYLGQATFEEMIKAGWAFQIVRNRMTHKGSLATVFILDVSCNPNDFCV